jgi:sulfur carrier protein
MTVYINNKNLELAEGSNITTALQAVGIAAGNGTALAVNSNVIPRTQWDSHILNDNDKIMIIKATQGG